MQETMPHFAIDGSSSSVHPNQMKTKPSPILACIAGLVIFASVVTTLAQSTYVSPYLKKDGTYVQGHHRSLPDGNFYNNWSTKPNVNPYTGMEGTRVTPRRSSGYGSFDSGSLYRSTPSYSVLAPSYTAPSFSNPSYSAPRPSSPLYTSPSFGSAPKPRLRSFDY